MKIKTFALTFLIFSLFSFQIFAQEEDTGAENVANLEDIISAARENITANAEENAESQEEDNTDAVEEEIVNIKGEEFTSADTFVDFIRSLDFVFDIGPSMYMNLHTMKDDKPVSAPSPLFEPVTIGMLWPNYTFVSTEPSLSFFSFYYLWYDDMALPAEIENRTVQTLHFMLNIPIVIQLYMKHSRLQLSGGIGILGRFGLLAGGVAETDSGGSGTAGSDLELMNDWFWDKTRYLYISTGASWLYNGHNNTKVGPTVKVYFPLGGILNGEGFQGLIIDAGLKISL